MFSMLSALEPIARITVATLFNSLWEAALLALIVYTILRFMPNASATTRYAAWAFALCASILLPIATAIPQIKVTPHQAQTHAQTTVERTSSSARKSSSTRTAPQTTAARTQPATAQLATKQAAPVQARSNPVRRGITLPGRFSFAVPNYVALGLFAAWALAALVLLVRLGINLYRLERLKTDALPLPLDYRERLAKWAAADKGGREVRLCICDRIEVPVAVGLFDSMILIPQHLLDTLSQDEIDQIMLHELAHLRRADDWTNGVQRLIQALFFFNPAILFIAQQLDLEREVACDDWVVRQTSSVRPYASCLTKMAEVTAWPHRAMAAPGVFVTRRGLSVRVERLLRAGRDIRTSISFGPAGTVVAAFVVVFFVLQSVAPTFAFTQEDIVIPAQHVQIPPQTLHLPAREIKTAKGQHIHVGPQTVRVAGGTVDLPPQHLRVTGGQVSQISPPDVTIPARHYEGRNSRRTTYVEVPSPNIHVNVPSDFGANAANLAMQASSEALRDAADALKTHAYSHSYSHANSRSDGQGWNCVGCDYSNQNMAGKSFRGQRFSGADFSHDDLHSADFSNTVLTGVDFSGANLRGVSFRGAKMTGCDLTHADITGASFDGADVTGCDVDGRSLAPDQAGQWLRACRNGCDLTGANLRGEDLHGLDLTGVDLSDADLTGANLEDSKLSGVDFSGARLDGARLSGAEFVGCDFTGVNLRNVDMTNAHFTGDKFDGNDP